MSDYKLSLNEAIQDYKKSFGKLDFKDLGKGSFFSWKVTVLLHKKGQWKFEEANLFKRLLWKLEKLFVSLRNSEECYGKVDLGKIQNHLKIIQNKTDDVKELEKRVNELVRKEIHPVQRKRSPDIDPELQGQLQQTIINEEARMKSLQQLTLEDPLQRLDKLFDQHRAEANAKHKESSKKYIADRLTKAVEILKAADKDIQGAFEAWQKDKNSQAFLMQLLLTLTPEFQRVLKKANDFSDLRLLITPEEWNDFLGALFKEPEMMSASQYVKQAEKDLYLKVKNILAQMPKNEDLELQKIIDEIINLQY